MRQGFELGIQWMSTYVLIIWRAIGSRSASWINLPTRRPEHPGYFVGLLLKKSSKMYHVWVLSNSTASSHGWFPERKAFFIVGPGSLSNDDFTLGLALGRSGNIPPCAMYLSNAQSLQIEACLSPANGSFPLALWPSPGKSFICNLD